MTRLHQFVPMLHRNDAVGEHTLHVQQLLREHGLESDIFTALADPSTTHLTRDATDQPGGPGLYQFAVTSPLVDLLAARPDPLAVDSHNVTPPQFFHGWDGTLVSATAKGLAQLAQLSAVASLGIGDSTFNTLDLAAAGFTRTEVVPVLFDARTFDRDLDEPLFDQLMSSKPPDSSSWLFVGRVVPNKAQHDLVRAVAVYRRLVDPHARLWLVGGTSCVSYAAALRRLVSRLGLDDAVCVTGPVSAGALGAYYRAADVFVCLSDHEGFCVPLLEAMHHGLPVVAYGASAVPETLGPGGLGLASKEPAVVAEAVRRALEPEVGAALVRLGHDRLRAFSLERTKQQMWNVLEAWLATL